MCGRTVSINYMTLLGQCLVNPKAFSPLHTLKDVSFRMYRYSFTSCIQSSRWLVPVPNRSSPASFQWKWSWNRVCKASLRCLFPRMVHVLQMEVRQAIRCSAIFLDKVRDIDHPQATYSCLDDYRHCACAAHLNVRSCVCEICRSRGLVSGTHVCSLRHRNGLLLKDKSLSSWTCIHPCSLQVMLFLKLHGRVLLFSGAKALARSKGVWCMCW